MRALRRHLPPAPELTTATLQPPDETTTTPRRSSPMSAPLLLLTSLAVYGQWVVAGVVEEKNNRVVELILSTVRPRHLLAGKVIGIGLLGLAQLALVAGLAAVLLAAGVFDAPPSLGGSVALVIPWFALGFALYAVAYAAAGALAPDSRTRTRPGNRSPTRCSPPTSPATSPLAADANGLARATLLTSSRSPHRSSYPPGAPSSACRSGSTCSRVVLVLASIYALVRFAGRIYARPAPQRPAPRPARRLAPLEPVLTPALEQLLCFCRPEDGAGEAEADQPLVEIERRRSERGR